MIHLLHNVDLSLEPLYLFRVTNGPLLDDLNCSFEVANLVDTPAYLAERTLAQLLQSLVVVGKETGLLLHEGDLGYFVHVCSAVGAEFSRGIRLIFIIILLNVVVNLSPFFDGIFLLLYLFSSLLNLIPRIQVNTSRS